MPDELMPNPTVWPECSECHVAYALRRALSMSKGWIWVWSLDCKHKKAEAYVVNAEGRVDATVGQRLA